MNKLSTLATGLVALTLFVAACGDDDEPTTTSDTGTSGATGATGASGSTGGILPADFVADADAICTAGDDELDAEAQALGQNASEADQVKFAEDVVVPNIQGQIEELRSLDEPESGADEFGAFLDDAEAAVEALGDDPGAVLNGGSDPFAGIDEQAKELGFEECGR